MYQFHILFAKLWIWEHAVFTLLRRLKCFLNLSSEQQKVSSDFLEKSNTKVLNFGLLGIKSVHSWPDSPSWYTDSWPYTAPPRLEPHSQLPSLLVHWSFREKNTHAVLYKCGGVCQIKQGKSGLQVIVLTGGTISTLSSSLPFVSFLFSFYFHFL